MSLHFEVDTLPLTEGKERLRDFDYPYRCIAILGKDESFISISRPVLYGLW
jgi:hypothetical protein